MKRARLIVPATGDFATTPGRQWAPSEHPLQNKLLLAYSVALGSWEGDPLIGHRFGELAREKDSPGTRQRLRGLIIEAAEWLVRQGDLERVDAAVEYFAPGQLAFSVVAIPAGGAAPVPAGPFFVAVAL